MKVAVVGSRSIKSVNLAEFIPPATTEIISGGASGVDRIAEKYADERRLSKHIIKPDYDKHGKNAPILRNMRIVELSDLVIALWDGVSSGTAFTIKYARKLGKPIKAYTVR